MGKSQMTTTETEYQGQGVCEKIFKALTFRSSRRNSPVHPQGQSSNSAATRPTVATTDRHRNDPAKSTMSEPVALHQPPAQNGSTIPLHLKGHQIPLYEKDQNMVPVEYNHNSGDTVNKSGAKMVISSSEQDPKGIKAEAVNKSPVTNMVDKVHKLNEDSKVVKSEDYSDISSKRFTKYIDHVKEKMITLSSLEDDDDDDSSVARTATRRDSFNDKLSV